MSTHVVCVKDNVRYVPHTNVIPLVTMFSDPQQPYQLWQADMLVCPICGHKVVAGFGDKSREHFQEGFDELLEAAETTVDEYELWALRRDLQEMEDGNGNI